jgi:acetyl esterase/lipase
MRVHIVAFLILSALLAPSTRAHADGRPGVEQDTKAFLEALDKSGGTPIEKLSPAEARAALGKLQAGHRGAMPEVEITERRIQAEGKSIALTIVRPPRSKQPLPVVMFFHGGGWVLGDFPTHERLVRELAVGSGAAVVFVHYTPSPEARYPVAVNEAYAATRWVAEHGQTLGLDRTRLAVAGNSVGGNMAAVVALMAKDRGGPRIRYQVLFYPVTDAGFETASYRSYGSGYFLTTAMMKWFWSHYTTDPAQRREIYASPLQASLQQLRGLPPALIQTAEFDVLRDEGEAYARKLDEAGVEVTATRYLGTIHDFGLLNVLARTAPTRASLLQATEELKRRLAE